MFSEAVLLWGLLFSSFGLGFFVYGRKQRKIVPLLCGIALMLYPWFVTSVPAIVALGVVLTAIPYFLRL